MTTVGDDISVEGPADRTGSGWRGRPAAWLAAERAVQAERWFLWSPVAAGFGAAAYFCLRTEPSWIIACGVALAALVGALGAKLHGESRLMVIVTALIAFAAAGFGVATLRTHLSAAPIVRPTAKPVMVEGWVVDVDSAAKDRPRLLMAPTRVGGQSDLPKRIRLTLRDHPLIGPGQAVRTRAILNPPPPPASPGSYDFARDAYFDQVGGSALVLSAPTIVTLEKPEATLRIAMTVNATRWSLARRMVERMGEDTGGLAAALVTGHQAWLEETDIEAMRASGLAHILSISGVHMAIVGGFVFAVIRMGIAAWPWAALRIPGKKVAAAGALTAVLAYLAISGAPPPAERAAITAGVAFLAILMDRRALTLHSLAIAALVVLVLQPQAVTQPGFQMSFAATAALLAMVEAWPSPPREINTPWPIRLVQGLRTWLTAGFLISFIAGLATGPFAIQHFNRVTVWGLPANLASEALSSFVVLPFLALGAPLELWGLGGPFLAIADWGLKATRQIAMMFAGLPGAEVLVASAPPWALPLSFFGLMIVCLAKTPLRLIGLPLFGAIVLAPRPPIPDIWIADGGANAAVHEGGIAIVMRPESQAFASDLWSRRRGLKPPADPEAAAEPAFACTRDACIAKPDAPVQLALWRRRIAPAPEAAAALCKAQIIVVRTGSVDCGPDRLVLDEAALRRGGSAELYRADGGWRVVWAADLRGHRPWTRS